MTVYTAPPTQSHLVLNFGDTLNVEVNGLAYNTVINQGAVLNVGPGGTAIATTINVGGLEIVTNGGTDKTVIFAGSNSLLDLAKPTGLTGTIIDWHVGDIIDLLHTAVTSVREDSAHTTLTVTYGTNQTAIYMLAGQQADTQFRLQSDGNGGTDLGLIYTFGLQPIHETAGHLLDLILTPILGVQPLHEAAGHLA